MSLVVWLPLTKDLRQQGLNSATIEEVTSTVFDNGGKLGKCLSGGKIKIPANQVASIFNNTSMSIAFWYNNNTSETTGNHAICGFSGDTEGDTGSVRIWDFFNYSNPNTFHWSMGTLGGGILSNIFPANTWVHVCVTWDAPTLKIYMDGILKYTGSGSSDYTFNKSYYISFGHTPQKLNDFRIYNHCLSQMEVKEVAKGLVLHYPLNRQGWGQENLITGYDTSFLSYPNGAVTLFSNQMNGGAQEIVSNIEGATKCLHLHSNGGNGRQYGTLSATSGKSYIISCDYYSTSSQATPFRGELNGGNYSWVGSNAAAYTTPNKWVRLSFSYLNLTSDATIYYFMQCSQNTDCYIKNLKIEEGSIATPWCPNSSDILATTMGLNSTTEYDCSGFCNNGTRTGTFSWTSDTPKYQVSTHIGATNQKIHISNFPTSGFGDSYSFAWWGKRNSNSPMFWGFSNGIRLNGMYGGTLWNTGDSSNNPIYKPGTTTKITEPSVDVWHHYVMTGDGTTCKLYLDGELYGQAKTYKAISGTSIWINGWDSGTRYCSDNTDISDFRIYTTALSANDVKSLYQNSAYIDSSGNVYGAVHAEA